MDLNFAVLSFFRLSVTLCISISVHVCVKLNVRMSTFSFLLFSTPLFFLLEGEEKRSN